MNFLQSLFSPTTTSFSERRATPGPQEDGIPDGAEGALIGSVDRNEVDGRHDHSDASKGLVGEESPATRVATSDSFGKGGRTAYMNQECFDETFGFLPTPVTHHPFRRHVVCCNSPNSFVRFLLSFLPILHWLPRYKWRDSLVGDMMAGLTVGIVHVPQGIAYAILTGVEPVYGLYTSFFGVLFYMVFGTSRYVSIGSFAIISLMTGVSCREIYEKIEDDYVTQQYHQQQRQQLLGIANITSSFGSVGPSLPPRPEYSYEELVQAITLTSGLLQLLMAVLRVEFLASYLSDQLVSGFCTGAAVHVVVVQVNKLLQLPPNVESGPGYLIAHVRNMFSELSSLNRLSLAISIASFIFLYVGKDVINKRMRRRLPAPIPFELLLVVLVTAASYLFQFHSLYNVKVVNHVPVGLPVAHLPRFELLRYVIGDAMEIAFVVLALHLSMCKVFNRMMGSQTNNNLELYAMGFVATLSSFFNTYPISSSIGRSMLNVECGAKSQLSALFTGALLLVVILFLGPLLASLPMAVLAVIIIYSMKSVFQKMPHELMHLWRVSKIDFMIWVVAFLSTVILNVMQGLALAVGFALLTTVFRIQWPRWYLLSRLNGAEDYRDSGRYAHVTDVDSVRIFRFDAPLLFTNVEHFANSARKAVTDVGLLRAVSVRVAPKSLSEARGSGFGANGAVGKLTSLDAKLPPSSSRRGSAWRRLLLPSNKREEDYHQSAGTTYGASMLISSTVEHFIIDCSGFTFVDYSSVNALIDLQHNQVNVYFAGAKAPIRDTFEVCGFYKSVPKEHFFPTIHDAVLAAIDKKRLYIRKRGVSEPIVEQANRTSIPNGETGLHLTAEPATAMVGLAARAVKKNSCHPRFCSEQGTEERVEESGQDGPDERGGSSAHAARTDAMTSTSEISRNQQDNNRFARSNSSRVNLSGWSGEGVGREWGRKQPPDEMDDV